MLSSSKSEVSKDRGGEQQEHYQGMEAATNQCSIYNASRQRAFCEAQYAKKQLRNLVLL